MKAKSRRASPHPLRAARRMSVVLGRVPSMLWGAFYLLLVPAFALFYTFLPAESFYHSTIQNEAMYKRDREVFEQDLEAWAMVIITPRLGPTVERVYGQRFKEIHYYAGFGPDDWWPRLLASVQFEDGSSKKLEFWLGGMDYYSITRDALDDSGRVTTVRSEGFDLAADCREAAECETTRVERALGDRYFPAPADINDRVERLRQLADGLNSGVDLHAFGRMLYLSAVTVTTVGYGDIVPLTDTARIGVACEAILGIVLVGLFLNALAYEHQSWRSRSEGGKAA